MGLNKEQSLRILKAQLELVEVSGDIYFAEALKVAIETLKQRIEWEKEQRDW
jgi:hypothetical protein